MALEVPVVTVGVVLLLVAGVLSADLVLENSGHTDVMIMGQTLSFNIWGLFVLGLAAGVLVVAGVQLLLNGMARDHHRRRLQRQRERELAALTRTATAQAGAAPSPAPAAAVSAAPAPTKPVASPSPTAPTAAPTATAKAGHAAAPTPGSVPRAGLPEPQERQTAVLNARGRTAAAEPSGATEPPAVAAAAPSVTARDAGAGRTTATGRDDAPVRSAVRMPTPARPTPGGGPAGSASTRPNSHPRRGDRIVARVADLRRRDGHGGDGEAAAAARPADARS